MELRHLHYFVVLAEELHFSAAAARLGIAAPTLSVQIRQLEQQLAATLLQRNNRQVRLTEAGALFLVEARKTLAQAQRALETGRRAGRGETGSVNIGYVSSALWSGVLATMVNDYNARYPGVSLFTREEVMTRLPQQVSEGAIDVAMVRGPMPLAENVDCLTLWRDRFIIALPARHPLAQRSKKITPQQLKAEKFIVPEQPAGAVEVARRGGFALDNPERPGSLLEVLTRVSLNQGVAVIPDVLQHHVLLPEVVYRTLAGAPIRSEITLLFRRWETSPVLRQFIALARMRSARQ
ncbi:hypothetical protein BTJ39_03925 [Izhakiella australiensis]|uniref:HTH lysR-type domain-containing protein n=1 Tax=Izhakiella australiensis TaxID=1926881 RepID=A0A1S8YQT0_9GAMM|nr:hypothetical protein BTJ39_03925 [Izhakiella australiensis]